MRWGWLAACYSVRWLALALFAFGEILSVVLDDRWTGVLTLIPAAVVAGALEHVRRNS